MRVKSLFFGNDGSFLRSEYILPFFMILMFLYCFFRQKVVRYLIGFDMLLWV